VSTLELERTAAAARVARAAVGAAARAARAGTGASQRSLAARFQACRRRTEQLVEGLSDADLTVQSMPDASPGKWHLGHTTWFFETFVLEPTSDHLAYHDDYAWLFNSYYDALGARQPRHARGLLTRPSLAEVFAYRRAIDEAVVRLCERGAAPAGVVELGIQHEQQHQELLVTDLLHLFAQNPLRPAVRPAVPLPMSGHAPASRWIAFDGGPRDIGHDADGFGFDSEQPRHVQWVEPYALASRPVTNRDWCDFIADDGYHTPSLWLADGWMRVRRERWRAPLYWRLTNDGPVQMTLAGEQPVDPDAPVCHVSHFEADAYARWAGARLPTEAEWEAAARVQPVHGHFADSGRFRPAPVREDAQSPLAQLYGDVWEWTSSPFIAYPGFRPAKGAVGEYNGKFMSGQMVLRGGSCATPSGHVRASYRNFFQPHQRWQFSGLRLAKDLP
jgi:ergothioneine biosynthesis protein EgtB